MNNKGKNSPNYRHGETLKQHYCSCGNKISYNNFRYGKKQCRKCYLKNSIKKYYCIDCGKELSKNTCQRCYSCNTKGKRNPMFGKPGYNLNKHLSNKTKRKLSISHGGTGIPHEFNDYPAKFYYIRINILKRDNYKCKLCHKGGNTVHHIDYNKQNNRKENLIILCPKCHTKTNTNRDYWFAYFTYIMEHRHDL